MHLNAKPPVFVPEKYWKEIEQLSKAALMDMVWDYAMQFSGSESEDAEVYETETMDEFRRRREIIEAHRNPKR